MMMKQGDNIKTFEQVLNDPSLAHLHEAIEYIEKTSFSKAFPKKHEAVLTNYVQRKTVEIFNQQPDLPLKTVVTVVIDTITDTDISAALMLKLTKKIIKTREELLAATQAKSGTIPIV